jgi:hypothetical protein
MSPRSFSMLLCALAAAGCAAREVSPTSPTASTRSASFQDDADALAPAMGGGGGGPQSATGHGNLTVGGELRTFSFNAIRHKDGTVTGEFQLNNRASGVVWHGEVTCLLAIARPNQGAAFMGGVVTRVDGPPSVEPGTPVAFSAFDSGEGSNGFTDAMTLVEPTTPDVVARQCLFGLRVGGGAVPIEDGNIQVRP